MSVHFMDSKMSVIGGIRRREGSAIASKRAKFKRRSALTSRAAQSRTPTVLPLPNELADCRSIP